MQYSIRKVIFISFVVVAVLFSIIFFYLFKEVDYGFELKIIGDFQSYEMINYYYPPDADNVYWVKNNDDEYGFINLSDEVIVEPRYERPGLFVNGVASVVDNGEEQYIDNKGNVIIDNIDGYRILNAGYFYDGVAVSEVGDSGEDAGNVLIDYNGEVLLYPTLDKKYYVNFQVGQGLVNVFKKDNGMKYLNTVDIAGNEISDIKSPVYYLGDDGIGFYKEYSSDISRKQFLGDIDYYDPIGSSQGYGIFNLNNMSKVTDVEYSFVTPFKDGLAVVTLANNNDICIINNYGQIIANISEKNEINNDNIVYVGGIADDRILIRCVDEQGTLEASLVFDSDGNLICNKYFLGDDYSDGIAIIVENDKYGYVDIDGNVVLEADYDFIGRFYDGKSLVVKDDVLYQFSY